MEITHICYPFEAVSLLDWHLGCEVNRLLSLAKCLFIAAAVPSSVYAVHISAWHINF